MNSPPRTRRKLPLRRRLAFLAVLVLVLPALMLLAAEGIARLLIAPNNDDPFLTLTSPASAFTRQTIDGEEHYVVTHNELYTEKKTSFPIAKSPKTLRIFCLGGSAAAGWPHPPQENYAAYLRTMLAAAYPANTVEVHNVGGHGFASYRVRQIFGEVLEFEPDLIVVYSGNNEFVEKRSYLRETGLVAVAEKLARYSRLAEWLHGWARRRFATENTLSGRGNTNLQYHLWAHIEKVALELRTDAALHARVDEHYAYTMRNIATRARERGVPLIFLTVPANLRDWAPHVSRHGATDDALRRWEKAYRAGRRALDGGQPEDAARNLAQAAAVDPLHADTWYQLGRAREGAGDPDGARQAFVRAKDEDCNPFRVLSSFNTTLGEIAVEVDGASLLDMEAEFGEAAATGSPGFTLLLDYVHPTKRGNVLLARTLLPHVVERLAPRFAAEGNVARILADYVETDYDEASNYGMHVVLLQLFRMMHQYESFVRKADTLLTAAAEGRTQEVPVDLVKLLRDRFAAFLDEERRDYAGEPFDADYRDKLRDFYRTSFGLGKDGRPIQPADSKAGGAAAKGNEDASK